jgi:beta-lactamase class A
MRIGRRRLLGGLALGAAVACRAPAATPESGPAPRPLAALVPPTPTAPAAPADNRIAFAPAGATVASSATPGATSPPGATPPPDDGRALERAIDSFVRQRRGSFGVAVRDLAGTVAVEVDGRERFTLASLYKVVLLYEVMRRVGAGQLRLDDPVTTPASYAFGEPEGGIPPDSRVTIDEAARTMIEVSSNAAALALIELVTPDGLAAAPSRLGLRDTTIDAQSTGEPRHYWIESFGSAHDLVELFVRLGRRQLVDPALDQRMIGYLLRQRVRDRLPLLLPAGTPVGHKTGEFDGFTHDAGLVLLPARAYAIVVLAEGESVAEGRTAVAELSRLAYLHFSSAA